MVNNMPFDMTVRDEEDHSRWRRIPGRGGTADFSGTIFPWCVNSDEIKRKAFAFYLADSISWPPVFWMFQNYRDNKIYWVDADHQADLWNGKRWGGANPSSYADISFEEGVNPPALVWVAVRAR